MWTLLDSRPPKTRHRSRPRYAVLGAGVAGLACARRLREAGITVDVLDRGQRPGGRLASFETEHGGFDHGAQYFTVSDRGFARQVQRWRKRGLVAEWKGRFVTLAHGRAAARPSRVRRFVGVPCMSRVAEDLAGPRPVIRAEAIHAEPGDPSWIWTADGKRRGPYRGVVFAMPPPQWLRLVPPGIDLAQRVRDFTMVPCFALLLAFDRRFEVDFDAAFVSDSPLSWIARNSSKPGRRGETWVLHADSSWSEKRLLKPRAETIRLMRNALQEASGRMAPRRTFERLFRWRAAAPLRSWPEPCVVDAESRFVACGDWCGGSRVEGAYLSGHAAASAVLAREQPVSALEP